MDDIRLYRKPPEPVKVTRFSIFRNGSWSFLGLNSLTFTIMSEGLEYTRPQYPRFGILYSSETDARKVFTEGKLGDYLLKDSMGNLSIVPKEKFDKKY